MEAGCKSVRISNPNIRERRWIVETLSGSFQHYFVELCVLFSRLMHAVKGGDTWSIFQQHILLV